MGPLINLHWWRDSVLHRPLLIVFISLANGIAVVGNPFFILGYICLALLIWNKFYIQILALLSFILGIYIVPEAPKENLGVSFEYRGVVTVDSIPRVYENIHYSALEKKNKKTVVTQFIIRDASKTKYLLEVKGEVEYNFQDVIEILAMESPLSEVAEKKYELNYIQGKLIALDTKLVTPSNLLWKKAHVLNTKFKDFADKYFGSNTKGLVQAIIFNIRNYLPADTYTALIDTGTIHVVSTSGMHITIVNLLLLSIISLFMLPRKLSVFLIAGILTFYGMSTGFHAPVIRALIMNLLGMFAFVLMRERDALSAFGLSGIVHLLWYPEGLYQVSFQLSHLGSLSLLLFSPEIHTYRSSFIEFIKDKVYSFVNSSIMLSLVSAPILAFHFGSISIVSVLANLLILWVVPMIILLTLLAWGCSYFFTNIAQFICSSLVEPLMGWILFVIHSLSKFNYCILYVPKFSFVWVMLFYCCIFILWRPRIRSWK